MSNLHVLPMRFRDTLHMILPTPAFAYRVHARRVEAFPGQVVEGTGYDASTSQGVVRDGSAICVQIGTLQPHSAS